MATQPNVKEAYAMFQSKKVAATYDEASKTWSVTMTAPAESSWSQPNHVYLVELYAVDLAGNTGKLTSTDETYGAQLKIRVLEKTKPTATVVYPTQNSVIGKNTITAKLKVVDAGGSGINQSSISVKVNGEVKSGISWVSGASGELTADVALSGLSDGSNNITVDVQDNDGNAATQAKVTFIISTAAPKLDITEPADNLVTNGSTVTVAGNASAGGSYSTVTKVTVNGEDAGVDLDSGDFSYDFELSPGENTITIVVTDNAGNTTTVTRHVTLDTTVPVITEVKAVATTVDASGQIKITFKVVEN